MPVKPVPEGYHTATPYLIVTDADALRDPVRAQVELALAGTRAVAERSDAAVARRVEHAMLDQLVGRGRSAG